MDAYIWEYACDLCGHKADIRPLKDKALDEDLKNLEQRVDDLISSCRRLQDENVSLKSGHDTLLKERSKLAEKNRLARVRLEAIIDRLKSLEKE